MYRIPAVARVEQGVLPAAARSGETLCGGCPRAELDPVLGDPMVLGIGAQRSVAAPRMVRGVPACDGNVTSEFERPGSDISPCVY